MKRIDEYLEELETKKLGYELKGIPIPEKLKEKLKEFGIDEEDEDYELYYLQGSEENQE